MGLFRRCCFLFQPTALLSINRMQQQELGIFSVEDRGILSDLRNLVCVVFLLTVVDGNMLFKSENKNNLCGVSAWNVENRRVVTA